MSHVAGKDKNTILATFTKSAQVGSSVDEQQKAGITVR